MKSSNLGLTLMSGVMLLTVGCTPATTPSPKAAGDLPNGEAPATVEQTSSPGGDVGKVTEDLWVEMAAQDFYQSNTDPEGWGVGGGRERMFAKSGITEAQLEAFGAQMNNDPERVQVLLGKMATRLQELEGGK